MAAADVLVAGGGDRGARGGRAAGGGRAARRSCSRRATGSAGGSTPSIDPEPRLPIELGAEFVHGHPAELVELIHRAGLGLDRRARSAISPAPAAAPPLPDVRAVAREPADEAAAPAPATGPWPSCCASARRHAPAALEVDAVAQYIEGFHAADLTRLGTRSLAQNEAAGGRGRRRAAPGARRATATLVAPHGRHARPRAGGDPAGSGRLRHPVAAGRGARHAGTRPTARQATRWRRAAIVTLPLPAASGGTAGEAPSGSIPGPPTGAPPLAALHMGAAHRVVLGFDTRWWAPDGADGPGFVHGSGEPFPVWWTALPSRAPLLTGWAGGPRAAALAGRGEGALLRAGPGLAGVRVRARRGRAAVAAPPRPTRTTGRRSVAGGAYSYGGVGAIEARAVLARPVRRDAVPRG